MRRQLSGETSSNKVFLIEFQRISVGFLEDVKFWSKKFFGAHLLWTFCKEEGQKQQNDTSNPILHSQMNVTWGKGLVIGKVFEGLFWSIVIYLKLEFWEAFRDYDILILHLHKLPGGGGCLHGGVEHDLLRSGQSTKVSFQFKSMILPQRNKPQ